VESVKVSHAWKVWRHVTYSMLTWMQQTKASTYIHTCMHARMCGYVCKHAWFGAFMSDVYIQMRAFPRTFPLVFVGESDEHRQMTMQTCMPIFGMWQPYAIHTICVVCRLYACWCVRYIYKCFLNAGCWVHVCLKFEGMHTRTEWRHAACRCKCLQKCMHMFIDILAFNIHASNMD